VTDIDRAMMVTGLDIALDYCLGLEDLKEEKKPTKKKKKIYRKDLALLLNCEKVPTQV
jgi:hypothetical protein